MGCTETDITLTKGEGYGPTMYERQPAGLRHAGVSNRFRIVPDSEPIGAAPSLSTTDNMSVR